MEITLQCDQNALQGFEFVGVTHLYKSKMQQYVLVARADQPYIEKYVFYFS